MSSVPFSVPCQSGQNFQVDDNVVQVLTGPAICAASPRAKRSVHRYPTLAQANFSVLRNEIGALALWDSAAHWLRLAR